MIFRCPCVLPNNTTFLAGISLIQNGNVASFTTRRGKECETWLNHVTRELGEFEKNEKNKIKDAPHNSMTVLRAGCWCSFVLTSISTHLST